MAKNGDQPTKVHGNFKFNKIRGVLAKTIKKEEAQVSGGFLLNGKVEFEHHQSLKKFLISTIDEFLPVRLVSAGLGNCF